MTGLPVIDNSFLVINAAFIHAVVKAQKYQVLLQIDKQLSKAKALTALFY